MFRLAKYIKIIPTKLHYLTLGFIIVYTFAAILVSVNRYWQYQTFYFDFGIFDMAIWKVSHFQIPTIDHVDISRNNIIIFADHFNPSIFLLSPLYWFTSRREVILIAQSVISGLAAFVAFRLADKYLKNKIAVLGLTVAFLGYVGLQNALITDFHEATVAVLPLMLIFWSIFNQKYKLFFIFLIILLGLKETLAGLGICLGIFLIIKDRSLIKIGIITIFISAHKRDIVLSSTLKFHPQY